jgi:hypothetical protein
MHRQLNGSETRRVQNIIVVKHIYYFATNIEHKKIYFVSDIWN